MIKLLTFIFLLLLTGCSNKFVIRTEKGEKIIIKKSSLIESNFTLNDLLNQIKDTSKKNIDLLEKDLSNNITLKNEIENIEKFNFYKDDLTKGISNNCGKWYRPTLCKSYKDKLNNNFQEIKKSNEIISNIQLNN